MAINQYIQALNQLGQSIWYDNLSLDVLQSGELEALVSSGVSGLTSNPTIFKKAIADSSHYDEKIRDLAKQGLSTDELCESLMVDDVGAAADLLRDTYDRTQGADGYASIEVSPKLAADTEGTVAAAERLWAKLARPNIMIKIPATPEGIPAIERVLSKGINVNITLIFSKAVYADVVNAYLKAVETLSTSGDAAKAQNLSSVASFFVSRVDALVEKKIAEMGKGDDECAKKVVGKIGIANSKAAYAHFEEIFEGEKFKQHREGGVSVQRPLWASTGTKNPEYPELLYVEALAGRDTVNTLPPKTLSLLLEDATIMPNLHEGKSEAIECIEAAAKLGLDFDALLVDLQSAGVDSFAKSYEELIEAVGKKREALAA